MSSELLTPDWTLEAVSTSADAAPELRDPGAESGVSSAVITDHLHSLIARLWLIFPVHCWQHAETKLLENYSEFVVRWGHRSDILRPPASVLVCSASPESPLSLNIPRPPTLNFPNLKSISVWKSTINFTLTCWTGGKKKITFNLEITYKKH